MRAGRWVRTLAAVLVVAGGTTVAASAPASAALPQCTTANWVTDLKGFNQFGREFRTYTPMRTDIAQFSQCILSKSTVRRESVRALQIALNQCYATSGRTGETAIIGRLTEDGIFGTNTRNALITVQQRLGRNPDGVYGPDTAFYMRFPSYWSDNGAYAGCQGQWEAHYDLPWP